MLRPNCDVCGQPATIYETTIMAKVATSRNLCEEHGPSSLPIVVPGDPADFLRAAEEHYHSLTDTEREHMALLYRLTKRGN